MYEWKVETGRVDDLEESLNGLEQEGFEIFSVQQSTPPQERGVGTMQEPAPLVVVHHSFLVIARRKKQAEKTKLKAWS